MSTIHSSYRHKENEPQTRLTHDTQGNVKGCFIRGVNVEMADGAYASGANAVAIGDTSLASGLSSVALGQQTDATLPAAVALGAYSLASGTESVAIGGDSGNVQADAANATAARAVAVGSNSLASGTDSLAAAFGASASAAEAISIGHNAAASAVDSMSIGHNSQATAVDAIAIGNAAASTGIDSTSLGHGATATGQFGMALGWGSVAGAQDAIAIGRNAVMNTAASFAISNGTSNILAGSGVSISYTGNAGISYPIFEASAASVTVFPNAGTKQWAIIDATAVTMGGDTWTFAANTAADILALYPHAGVGHKIRFHIYNQDAADAITVANGGGVTVIGSGVIAAQTVADCMFEFTNVGSGTEAASFRINFRHAAT